MLLFMGEYRCAMDEKGRLSFPARFREKMGESFIVAKWLDGCLVVFPESEWENVSTHLAEKSMVRSRELLRFLYSGANEVSPDKQGRILIPATQREHAGLAKDNVVIGVNRHVEIWEAGAWAKKQKQLDNETIEQAMLEIDF